MLRAKHVLVVVDTCFSGRVVAPSDVETTLPPLPTSAEVDRRARRHSFEILTAGRADEPVLDTAAEGSHSVLASTLLAELARIDEPTFVAQLVPEVQQRVANASRALRRPQTPAYHQLQRSDPGALVLVPGARYPQEGVRRAKGSRQLTPLAERRGFPWLTAVSGAVAIAGATTGAALLVARGQTQEELQSFGIATRTESRDEVERLEDVARRQGMGAAASLVVGGIGVAGFVIGLRAEL